MLAKYPKQEGKKNVAWIQSHFIKEKQYVFIKGHLCLQTSCEYTVKG